MKNAVILNESDSLQVEGLQLEHWELAYFTRKSPTKIGQNEDSLCILPVAKNKLIVAVADGVGGNRSASEASGIAVDSMRAFATEKDKLRNNVLDAIEEANQRILNLCVGAGTTFVCATLEDNEVRPFNIGDSSVLLTGQRKKIRYKNTPHSPMGYAEEAGVDGSEVDDVFLLLNALGSRDLMIDVGPKVEMLSNDTLLLCSDGLTDNLEWENIIDIIRAGPLLESANKLETLASEAMNKDGMKPDDLSFVLIRSLV